MERNKKYKYLDSMSMTCKKCSLKQFNLCLNMCKKMSLHGNNNFKLQLNCFRSSFLAFHPCSVLSQFLLLLLFFSIQQMTAPHSKHLRKCTLINPCLCIYKACCSSGCSVAVIFGGHCGVEKRSIPSYINLNI